ncbi:hypothetical protein BO71DRAFT_427834 [Aspergillus ellipticus CBS 707.79]|uniref:Uncharacterized protein n=1 Tax=Aspergillus ellipticus CBS 707.79 TaxID=1448320 RepID=A0A319DYS3_9EURO|nr:hypothetical protein BO71DRAFT_427834 [Aspergillus ellipticus CBS 707.79]
MRRRCRGQIARLDAWSPGALEPWTDQPGSGRDSLSIPHGESVSILLPPHRPSLQAFSRTNSTKASLTPDPPVDPEPTEVEFPTAARQGAVSVGPARYKAWLTAAAHSTTVATEALPDQPEPLSADYSSLRPSRTGQTGTASPASSLLDAQAGFPRISDSPHWHSHS